MERRVVGGFVAAAAVVAALVVTAWRTSAEALQDVDEVAHTYDVIAGIERTLSAMSDAETGDRGYVITGDPSFLEPYVRARTAAPRDVERLRTSTAGDPKQQERIGRLAKLIDAKFALIEKIVDLAGRKDGDRASIREAAREGERIMDAIRAVAADMRTEEGTLLDARVRESQKTHRRALVTYGVLTAAVGALLVALYATTGRRMAERRRMNEETARRERLLRAIVEGTTDAVYLKDLDGRYTMINSAGARLLGRPVEEILGRRDHELMSPATAASTHLHDRMALDSGETRTYEDPTTVGGVTRTYLSTKGPILNGAGLVTGLFGISRDITERKKNEAALMTLNEDLARRQAESETANRELEAFSYSVSHDLRAPLRHVAGFVDLLDRRARPTLDPQSVRYLDTIARAAKHMGDLIDDLLVFSRMGRAEFRRTTVDLEALAHEVVDDAKRHAAGRDVEWIVGSLPSAAADPSMLRLALVNLVDNAVKYTRTKARARIEIGASRTADEHVVFVRDDGVGFDMRYVDKLFGVFQRLHRAEDFEGTGIGLANVRRIVLRHGGRTWAEGVPGAGATFYFSLPVEAPR